jgi:hypothetical protein
VRENYISCVCDFNFLLEYICHENQGIPRSFVLKKFSVTIIIITITESHGLQPRECKSVATKSIKTINDV